MGAKTNYMNLIEDRKEIEERTRKLVLSKLSYLRTVGRSVLTKTHGGYSWEQEDLSYLGDLEHWLRISDAKLVRLEEHYIVIQHPKFAPRVPNAELKLPRRYLHLSDRDFAKEIRTRVRDRKSYLRKLEVHNAEENLQKAKREIEKQTKELVRLEKLVAIAKKNEERKRKTS